MVFGYILWVHFLYNDAQELTQLSVPDSSHRSVTRLPLFSLLGPSSACQGRRKYFRVALTTVSMPPTCLAKHDLDQD